MANHSQASMKDKIFFKIVYFIFDIFYGYFGKRGIYTDLSLIVKHKKNDP